MDFLQQHNELLQSFESNDHQTMQRTDDWFAQRLGKFTGSKMKNLMTGTQATAKMGWEDHHKILDFGSTAIKYVYSVAQKRRTNIDDMEIKAKALIHGEENEPLLIQQLLEDDLIQSHEDVGFVEFRRMPYAGASPDGKIIMNDVMMAMEAKSTISWDGHFNRFGELFDYKHNDFWQTTAEMMALRTRKCLFVAAYPGVWDQYDWKIVELSLLHAKALVRRLQIAEIAVREFIERRKTDPAVLMYNCIQHACSIYKF